MLVVLVLFTSGSTYTLRANFLDAGGLVTGDDVLIGGAKVGSVSSIGLTPDGQAQVAMGLDSNVGHMPQGTVARIYENSLSGIANKYVVLEPGTRAGHDSGRRPDHLRPHLLARSTSTSCSTRSIHSHGSVCAASSAARRRASRAAPRRRTRRCSYLAPALSSTSNVTGSARQERADVRRPARPGRADDATARLAHAQLTQLVSNTNATTAAIASQSQALEQALTLLGPTLNHSTATFAGLRSTLDVLSPLVAASIPASRHLAEFAAALGQLTTASIPTVGSLNALIRNPVRRRRSDHAAARDPVAGQRGRASFPRLIK